MRVWAGFEVSNKPQDDAEDNAAGTSTTLAVAKDYGDRDWFQQKASFGESEKLD